MAPARHRHSSHVLAFVGAAALGLALLRTSSAGDFSAFAAIPALQSTADVLTESRFAGLAVESTGSVAQGALAGREADTIDAWAAIGMSASSASLSGALLLFGAAFGASRALKSRGVSLQRWAADGEVEAVEEVGALRKAATAFCNLFALWLALAAIAALKVPATFTWVKASYFTNLLGILMFSVGITTTLDDFAKCLTRPGAIAINFLSCYAIMPILAYALAKFIGADGGILAGLVLVGALNGGQASNLCTLIAGGDVALSVLMTTSTTLGCIFMTPAICKLALGAVVPVDAMGIVYSTFQVVLAPIFLGVGLNTLAPGLCQALAPFTPVLGVISTVLLVGASVAGCAAPILGAGLPLQGACLVLHLVGGMLGYFAAQMIGSDERTCRTVAIETAMKSSAFGFLLASLHFGTFSVRVPPAVSVVWMAIVGSVMAVYWKGKPVKTTS